MRLRGNPLYVLPWYMVFGESESGKSSMINARLTSIASDAGPYPGISATRHCTGGFQRRHRYRYRRTLCRSG